MTTTSARSLRICSSGGSGGGGGEAGERLIQCDTQPALIAAFFKTSVGRADRRTMATRRSCKNVSRAQLESNERARALGDFSRARRRCLARTSEQARPRSMRPPPPPTLATFNMLLAAAATRVA